MRAIPAVAVIACGDTSAPSEVRALRFVQLSGGAEHTCGRTDERTTYCWGDNTMGQVGARTGKDTNSVPLPVPVRPLEFVSIDAGRLLSCGLLNTGVPLCWGSMNSSPRPVVGDHRMQSLGVGDFACGVRLDGVALCWNNPNADPYAIAPAGFSQVSVGGWACGLAADGTAWCWQKDGTVAEPVPGNLPFIAITVGRGHACGLQADGTALCWGENFGGQLGNFTSISSATPVIVGGGRWRHLSAGDSHTCGISEAGGGYCWGLAGSGRLGWNGNTVVNFSSPVRVRGPDTPLDLLWSVIAAGGAHSCGTTLNGRTFCWGANTMGQVGDGTTEARIAPSPIGSHD
jgi:alpha-tubulin suppressor-like RCC1 family protein